MNDQFGQSVKLSQGYLKEAQSWAWYPGGSRAQVDWVLGPGRRTALPAALPHRSERRSDAGHLETSLNI